MSGWSREGMSEEELRALLRRKDEFIRVISHALRTPLSTLMLGFDLLTRGELELGVRDRIRILDAQADRMLWLLDTLIEVTRLESGPLDLQWEDFDLADVVRQVTERLREPSERSGSTLVVHVAGPIPGTWDRPRIERVLVSLLANASKFGRGRPIEVTTDASDAIARVEIRDQGVGISEEDQLHLFARVERAGRHEAGDVGVSLWVARQVIEAHGGRIRVASRPGEGSTFSIELPRRPVGPGRIVPTRTGGS